MSFMIPIHPASARGHLDPNSPVFPVLEKTDYRGT